MMTNIPAVRASSVGLAIFLCWFWSFGFGLAAGQVRAAGGTGSYPSSHRFPKTNRAGNQRCRKAWSAENPPTEGGNLYSLDAVSRNDVWALGDNWGTDLYSPLIDRYNGKKWEAMDSPIYRTGFHLNAISALPDGRAWAVGENVYLGYGGPAPQALIEYFDGTGWSIAEGNFQYPGGNLYSVAALSAHDVWAVGDGIIQHFNGTSWQTTATPGNSYGYPIFNSVTALSARDVWAVGAYGPDSPPGSTKTLVEHFNGKHWSVVPSPNAQNGHGELKSVAGSSSSDVWAVGDDGPQQVIEHFNGKRWSVVPNPNGIQAWQGLSSVAVASARDVWAVGTGSPLEHYNGTRWSVVAIRNVARLSSLNAVAALSADDAWIVGYRSPSGRSLVKHFDGARWSVQPSPSIAEGAGSLGPVSADSSKDVWAGGTSNLGVDELWHYNGNRWSILPSPAGHLNAIEAVSARDIWAFGPGNVKARYNGKRWSAMRAPEAASGDKLNSVAATSASNIWAVGTGSSGTNTLPTIEHYNGKRWSVVNSPALVGGSLTGVSASSPHDVWAIGSEPSGVLIERYDGHTWSVVSATNITKPSDILSAIVAISPADVWAVGSTFGGPPDAENQVITLVVHYNGIMWSIVKSPNGSDGIGELDAVTALSPTDVWAVGTDPSVGYALRFAALVEHFDGKKWSVSQAPNAPYPGVNGDLVSITHGSPGELWAVGDDRNGGALVEHYSKICF